MKEILKKVLQAQEIEVSDEQLLQLCSFWDMVKETNKIMNLTAVIEDEDAAVKHFVDSLLGVVALADKKRVLDLGSGAGFPGIPLAILMPNTEFVLMDSLLKKVGFLNGVIKAMGLKNVSAIHARAEDAAKTDLRESFDAVTARAVAGLSTLLEYAMPFVSVGGSFVAYKAQEFEEEIAGAKNALEVLFSEILKIHKFSLNNQYNRVIIEVTKIKPTLDRYPRGQNKPKTNPLG